MTKKRAEITTIKIGLIEIEGIMLIDGTFAVAFPQVYRLFSIPQKHGARKLKAIVEEVSSGLSIPQKIASEIHAKKLSVLTLSEFTQVMRYLGKKEDNKKASDLALDLAGLSLQQLWSDAFGIKFEKKERQIWLVDRQEGKMARRYITDTIKYVRENGCPVAYDKGTIRLYEVLGYLDAYYEYKETHKDNKFRDTLDKAQLRRLTKMEELTADYVMIDGVEFYAAIDKASRYIR